MPELQTGDGLEREKLRYEVDKLKIEVTRLRRPLRQPTTWAAILIGLLTTGVVGVQYQLNQIQAESTKLDISKLTRDREAIQQELKALNEQRELDVASRLIPITDNLTHLIADIIMRKKG